MSVPRSAPVTDLAKRRCFITGAASGIGRATALAAGAAGAHLYLTDVDAAGLHDAVLEIRRAGGDVRFHAALDVSDFQAVDACAREIHAAHGAMDVVMNVAGISVWGTVQNMDHARWKRTIDVNLMGPIHVVEAFVPEMIRAGQGGHLVNVASAAGLLGLPWHAAYSASKYGLRGLSEVLRFDLERHGIGVSLVCPGAVDTQLVETIEILGIDGRRPELRKMKASFRKTAVSPESVARAILRGIEENRYLVFTSFDIRVAHFLERTFPFAYERIMRAANDRMHRVATRLSLPGPSMVAEGAAP